MVHPRRAGTSIETRSRKATALCKREEVDIRNNRSARVAMDNGSLRTRGYLTRHFERASPRALSKVFPSIFFLSPAGLSRFPRRPNNPLISPRCLRDGRIAVAYTVSRKQRARISATGPPTNSKLAFPRRKCQRILNYERDLDYSNSIIKAITRSYCSFDISWTLLK